MCRELHTTIYIYPRETTTYIIYIYPRETCAENYIQLFISTQERHVKRTRELHTTINLPKIYPRETCERQRTTYNYLYIYPISTKERHV